MAGGHGSTPATWTTVILVLIAFLVGAVGMVIGPNWTVFWVGAALIPVALIAGRVMKALGLGEKHPTQM